MAGHPVLTVTRGSVAAMQGEGVPKRSVARSHPPDVGAPVSAWAHEPSSRIIPAPRVLATVRRARPREAARGGREVRRTPRV